MRQLAAPARLPFSHWADYSSDPSYHPIISAEFVATDLSGVQWLGSASTNVMIDTGADITVLNADLAVDLGLSIRNMAELNDLQGLDGKFSKTYEPLNPVYVILCGRTIPLPVRFQVGRNPNLLGRAGLFNYLSLAFVPMRQVYAAI
ncbi:MAG: hypothetical protein ACLQCU_08880 [Acidimicrobiales bacterium]